jgi:hypothetical protein
MPPFHVTDDLMSDHRREQRPAAPGLRPVSGGTARLLLAAVLLAGAPGCAAFHPIEGVPASHLPPEFIGPSRSGRRTINPLLLTRSRPCEHLIDAGDVLAIYIPGVLGTVSPEFQVVGETPPINYPTDPEMPPTIGFPITVRGDGTVSLPQVPPISLRGMTLAQAEQAIRHAYTSPKEVLSVGKERILVSLQRPREYRVLVFRQETSSTQGSLQDQGQSNLGSTRRGTGRIVRLKANENDVLHALARVEGADGLPGLDAENAIYVIRRRFANCSPYGPAPFAAAPASYAATPQNGSVVRFQSPSDDYRRSSAYSGHSFAQGSGAGRSTAAPLAAPSMGGRYAAPQGVVAGSRAPTGASGRYPAAPMAAPVRPVAMSVPMASQRDFRSQPAPTYGAPLPQTPAFRPAPAPMAQPASVRPVSHVMSGVVPFDPIPAGGMAAPGPVPAVPPAPPVPPMGYGPLPVPGPGPLPEVDAYFRSMLMMDFGATIDSPHVIKIPVRLAEGEVPRFSEADVILEDGDIVFIESRDSEVFYTGGLLGGGEYTLPRDRDLRVLEALSIAQSRGNSQGSPRSIGGVSALNQDVTISASKVIVLRKMADGSQLPIEVDLNKVKREMTGTENIIVQPGDFLILQYSCIEAVGAFIERHLLEGALFTLAGSQFTGNGNN